MSREAEKGQTIEWEAAWWLAAAPGWGAVRLRQLTDVLGSPAQILKTAGSGISAKQLHTEIIRRWQQRTSCEEERLYITPANVERLLAHAAESDRYAWQYHHSISRGIHFILSSDEEYPRRLLTLHDRPFALYVRGRLPSETRKSAAVIGARACSGYGAAQGKRFARELASLGVQIISGLAYGVDSEGHRGALESGMSGATFAVLGCGVDLCYPAEHKKLAEQILENGGGLISELRPGIQPSAGNFPMRNRIISGLSDCILVMEARKRSGSLITVDQALEQGKEVFALPGRIDDRLSEGCHELIRNGAAILTCPEDVTEYLFAKPRSETNGKDAADSDQWEQSAVYRCLDCAGKSTEEILYETGLPLGQVHAELLELILADCVVETAKGYYCRKAPHG